MAEILEVPHTSPKALGFCETASALAMMDLMRRQHENASRGMTVILGPSGFGKSRTAMEFQRRYNFRPARILSLTGDDYLKAPVKLRRAIADQMNIFARHDREIRDGIRHWIVMIGNKDAFDHFAELQEQDAIEAFGRRIWQCEIFKQSSADDVEAYARHLGITRPDLIGALHEAAEGEGLDGVNKVLEKAWELAEADGKRLGVRHIQEAIRGRFHRMFAAPWAPRRR
jgi:hypothetical protein